LLKPIKRLRETAAVFFIANSASGQLRGGSVLDALFAIIFVCCALRKKKGPEQSSGQTAVIEGV
jgi:hypothetical protein